MGLPSIPQAVEKLTAWRVLLSTVYCLIHGLLDHAGTVYAAMPLRYVPAPPDRTAAPAPLNSVGTDNVLEVDDANAAHLVCFPLRRGAVGGGLRLATMAGTRADRYFNRNGPPQDVAQRGPPFTVDLRGRRRRLLRAGRC